MFNKKNKKFKEKNTTTTGDNFVDFTKEEASGKHVNVVEKEKANWGNNFKVLPLALISGGLLFGSIGSYILYSANIEKTKQTIQHISTLNVNSDALAKNAIDIRNTEFSSFDDLTNVAKKLESLLTVLRDGGVISDSDTKINPVEASSATQLKEISDKWINSKIVLASLTKRKDELFALDKSISQAQSQSQTILEKSFVLQKEINKAGTPKTIKMVNELVFLAQRSANKIESISYSSSFSLEDGYALIKDLVFMEEIINVLKNGSPVYEIEAISSEVIIESVKQLKESLVPYAELSNNLKSGIVMLNNSKELSTSLSIAANDIKKTIDELNKSYGSNLKNLDIYLYLSLVLFLLFVLNILLISMVSFHRSKKYEGLAREFKRNQNNEQVAENLLDQLKPLDDGDFTQSIFVEDKFLGNIAESIDKTRLQFGEIVKQIKKSAANILNAAELTDNTTQNLSNIAQKQFDKIDETIQKISEITNDIDEIAQSAYMAQEESNRSSQESEKGKKLVDQSIEKMSEIRNTIQESSKKIKKLGESAQSITEVTSLIKDITKQINILALNAAIQAASSGESGREFSVVAQEVQRLADDSETATKKIEELINDIQSDTAVAIASMEKTTQEVVFGAQLTEQAGVSLTEISSLSKTTADQILAASSKLEEKSAEMAQVTVDMQGLQTISKEAQAATNITTSQVESLKGISETLEETFQKFKV